ncbi:MAG: hypothetical protein WBB11_05625, partial [Ferruginibacter sp.]
LSYHCSQAVLIFCISAWGILPGADKLYLGKAKRLSVTEVLPDKFFGLDVDWQADNNTKHINNTYLASWVNRK